MLLYRAALPLSHQTLTFVAGLIRVHRREIGSAWRKLTPADQALLVLIHLRKGEPFAEVAAGFSVSTSTCWRHVHETVELLAARAPQLDQALHDAKKQGMPYLVLDGTLVPIDRIAADRPFYSGKHRRHGMNLQTVSCPKGELLWISGDLPGSTHDTTAARIWQIPAALANAGLIAMADKGYQGLDPTGNYLITPYKGRDKPASEKDANRAHARLRGPGERTNAQLKTWRILRKLRCCPRRTGTLAKAIHVLHAHERAATG